MNNTMDVILVNRCNQSDEFRTVLTAKMCVRVLLTLMLAAAAMLSCTGAAAGAELHVNPGAGTPIQDAIDSAGEGDTIYVHAGTYCENVGVYKRLTLEGDGADVVTVTAANAESHVFYVTMDWVNISGFTVTGATGSDPHYAAGIYLYNAEHCNIFDIIASNNYYGICLGYSSSNNVITNNTANSNSQCGIYLYSSNTNTLTSNTITNNNNYGTCLYYSSNDNTIYHNNLIDNTYYNAYDSCTNTWDCGTEGNYYSDYTGTDPDNDSIGEDPHPIPGGSNTDRYPLMQPWSLTPQKGDLNSDSILTPADSAIALRIAASGDWDADADVSRDGRVTSLDALMILQAVSGGIAL